jgi:hypothetical protein
MKVKIVMKRQKKHRFRKFITKKLAPRNNLCKNKIETLMSCKANEQNLRDHIKIVSLKNQNLQ